MCAPPSSRAYILPTEHYLFVRKCDNESIEAFASFPRVVGTATVTYIPTFSQLADLDRISSDLAKQIIGELQKVAQSVDSLRRRGWVWQSLTSARLKMIVERHSVEYAIDVRRRSVVVLSVSPIIGRQVRAIQIAPQPASTAAIPRQSAMA
jgi:hypothetical protein